MTSHRITEIYSCLMIDTSDCLGARIFKVFNFLLLLFIDIYWNTHTRAHNNGTPIGILSDLFNCLFVFVDCAFLPFWQIVDRLWENDGHHTQVGDDEIGLLFQNRIHCNATETDDLIKMTWPSMERLTARRQNKLIIWCQLVCLQFIYTRQMLYWCIGWCFNTVFTRMVPEFIVRFLCGRQNNRKLQLTTCFVNQCEDSRNSTTQYSRLFLKL